MTVAAQTNHLESFLHKAEKKTLTTGIIGLGYVGLPLAQLFFKPGIQRRRFRYRRIEDP